MSEESHTTESPVTPTRHIYYQEDIDRLKKDRDNALAKNVHLKAQLCQANARAVALHDELERVKANHEKQLAFLLYEYMPANGHTMQETSILGPVDHNLVENDERVGDYIIGTFLGEGHYGEVFQGTHCETKKEYAIKCLKKHKIRKPRQMHQLEQELMVLKTMDHPNLIKMHQVLHAPSIIYIAMELGSMDLYMYARGIHFDEFALREITLGIIKPLDYLHFHGICHLDIKPENIMVMKDVPVDKLTQEHIKLCDFGLCAIAPSVQDGPEIQQSGMKGTPGYFAPEMVLYGEEHIYDARSADMWSVACTLLDLCEEIPEEWVQAYDHAVKGDMKSFQKGIQRFLTMIRDDDYFEDNSAFDLIRRLLRMDPMKRLSASQCLNHGWLDEDDLESEDDSDNDSIDWSTNGRMSM